MNKTILKQWLNDYLESGDGKGWRKDYESTFNKVQEMKQKLSNGYKLSAESDVEFLSELLKDDANGVASKGQSNLANEVFKKVIQDEQFLLVVEKLILEPSVDNYKTLNSYGSRLLGQLGSTNRPLLFNRACASCTLDVSTIVDRKKFSEFAYFLNEQKIIEFPENIKEKNWYSQNVFVVQEIREVFEEEILSAKTDIFWLNMFLWDIYAEKVATGFNAKSAVNYLNDRYPNTYSGTVHIATFKTALAREIALDPKSKTPVIICDALPPEELKLAVKKEYSTEDTRHHHLATHAKTLQVGNKAFSVIISNIDELEQFCDWYEKSDDQTTMLERKVKAFLELWPVECLKNLTIEDYHQAKNADCFISQIDSFDPTQGDPTFACYFDFWEPIGLGSNDKYHNEKPYSWHKRLGDEPEQAFQQVKQEILDIVDAVQRRDLTAIDQIQFTKGLKWMIAFLYQDFSQPCVIPIVSETNIKRIGYESYLQTPLPEFLPKLIQDQEDQSFFPYVEKLFAMVRKGYLANKQKKQKNEELEGEIMTEQALNRILSGAAGTGKTYHSINHALSIIENKSLDVLENEDRAELKARFDEYKEQGQIKFVTFHQSFSYEDFVEGIRAETNENGELIYDVKDGVLKELCDKARQKESDNDTIQLTKEVEFGKGYFIKKMTSELLEIQKPNGNIIHLSRILTDYLLKEFREKNITVKNLAEKKVIEVLGESPLLEPFIVNGYSAIWANLIPFLDTFITDCDNFSQQNSNYILIIDEINRGNISRIFGELITLIEDSKRQGADEALSVTLPYSKEEFSVPSNVYIIGTMNSSDRSLTGLDIALRRRFTFVEMPPQPEEIKNEQGELLKIKGKDKNGNDKDVIVADILSIINQRIEVLLDRDHCIGHANFMSLKAQPTLEHLADIFKQKIIPQLQEYFFDDWSKMNMVLNANGMLKPKIVEHSALFPNVDTDLDHLFEDQKTWSLVDSAFEKIESYTKMIKH